MRLLGFSPATWLLGIAALAVALGALHLLRVRLRRQRVDSLLFFQMLGAVHRPRVLFGRPARWLAFFLGLALLASLWSAFGDPRHRPTGSSRAVLIDASGAALARTDDGDTALAATAQHAASLVDDFGLGDRGAVIAFGAEVAVLLEPEEPSQLLVARAARLVPTGPPSAIWRALRLATHRVGDGGEIVVLGGPPLPDEFDGVPLEQIGPPPASATGIVDVRLEDWPTRTLHVEVTAAKSPIVVRLELPERDEFVRTVRPEPGQSARASFGDLPTESLDARLQVGRTPPLAFELPARQPLRVRLSGELPREVELAIAADPSLTTTAGEPDVIVTDHTGSTDSPALIVEAGTGARERTPVRTEPCPLPLSLRDRRRAAAPALVSATGETPWIEDLSGAALATLRRSRTGSPQLHVVRWLFDDPANRDVPILVLGALRVLAGRHERSLAAAGRPIGVPTGSTGATEWRGPTTGIALPHGALDRTPLAVGAWRPSRGTGELDPIQAFPAMTPAAAAGRGTDPGFAVLPGRDPLLGWILALGLLLLGADVCLYHRGRTP